MDGNDVFQRGSAQGSAMSVTRTTAGPGNVLAKTHGAQSPRIVGERTQAIVAEWTADETLRGVLTSADTAAVFATASALARLEELTAWLEAPDTNGRPRGALDSRGRPRAAMRLFYEAYRQTMSGLRQLGMTPSGRAELIGNVATARGIAGQLAARREAR